MDKVYLLIIGESVKAYASLKRLGKEAGLSVKKEDLPIVAGRVRILEVEVDTKPF